MEKNYDFRKGILSCTDRNVSSTDSAASKRAGFFSWFTKVLPLFALLFCATGSAQTPIEFSNFPLDLYGWKHALEWEPVTNCSRIVIRDGEEIVQSNCIIACKGSTVEYFIRDIFVDLYGIQDVAWDVTGGIIEETYDDSDLPKEQFGVKIQWDEDAPGGYIKMTIYTDIYPYVREVLVCVLFINSPEALFEPDGGNDKFCLGSEISFDNLTTPKQIVKDYLWDFGDGNYSSQFEPSHTYAGPGVYEVTLTAISWCGCESTYSMFITVTEDESPVIWCPGLVTDQNKHSYTVDDPCSRGGRWTADGGTIIGPNNGSSVDVAWNNVTPSDGFGYLHYQSNCGCKTTVKIPVVLEEAEITGDDMICVGEQKIYSLPQWATTQFSWSISQGSFTHTDQPNEVAIDGLAPGTYTLSCIYTNSIWGYSGTAEKEITVLEKPEIVAEDIKFCSGEEEHTYTTVSGNPVCWKLLKDGVSVLEGGSYYGEELDYTFTEGGLYILTASNNENCEGSTGCESDPVIIKVIQNPPAPEGDIEGSRFICQGSTYQYSYENTVPGTMLVWEAAGGAVIQGSDTGETVSVKFTGSGPYYISVKRQTIDEPVCVSEDVLTLTVKELDIDLTIISDNGFTFCPSSTEEFTADFGEGLEDFEPDYIEWQVYNSVGEFNFGSIIAGGNNSPDVVVNWNNITNNESTGWIKVKVIHCGVEYTKTEPITLHQPPAIAILSSDNICPGDETIDIELDLGGVTEGTVSFWFEGNPVPVEQDVQEDGTQNLDGSYTFTVLNNFNNTNATSVNQTLTVSLKYCHYTVSATETFVVFPETKINITPGYSIVICSDTEEYSHTIFSNLAVGDNASANFMWYKDEAPLTGWLSGTLGLAATSYTISGTNPPEAAGEYYVAVEDEYGCIVKSNKITVYVNDCGPPPKDEECQPYASSEIDITPVWACGEIVVTVDPEYSPEEYEWYVIGGTMTLADGQGTDTAIFRTDVAGEHNAVVVLKYEECDVIRYVQVTKFYEPKLEIGAVCGTGNTYDVTLYNTSVIFPGEGTLEYRYYEGSTVDPNHLIATTNGESYTLNGVTTTGLHTYTLAIVSSNTNLPVCSVTETIYLDPHTPPAFTISGSEFCAKDAIELTITNHVPGYIYTWEFYNTSYTTSEEITKISIEDAGAYWITLTTQTPYGCTLVSDEEKVDVYKAEFTGTFNFTSIDICESETAPSIAFVLENEDDDMPSGYIWMNGNAPVPGATGATFVPTQSGMYWAVLVDENGCKDSSMASEAVNVNIRPLPAINILGDSHLCYGERTIIKGVAGSGAEHKWQLGGVDMGGDYGEWSDDPDLLKIEVENTGSLAPGTYEYTLWVRYADMPGCAGSKTFTLNVYDQLTEPQLGYVVELCEPYTVRIYVTNVQTTGHYEWANGDTESYTFVYAGGIYRVTYIDAESGCRITSDIQVPDSPEQSMWFFPSGCFDICPWGDPQPYIMGLDGMFDYHEWLVNGAVAQSDTNNAISSIDIDQPGTYQLSVTQEKPGPDCIYESGIAYISPSMATLAECEVPQCTGLVHALNPPSVPHPSGKYYIYGNIGNNYPVPVTVTISSFNGYGTYTPGTITIPAYGNHSFNPSPLVFTPNPGFNGGDDYIVISIPDMPCVRLFPRSFPVNPYTGAKMMPKDTADAFLRVTPNPAGAMAAVSYGLGTEYQKAESLKIYTMLGTLVAEINLHTNNDDLPLDISRFPAGTYIITLQADGNTVLHQKLIKK